MTKSTTIPKVTGVRPVGNQVLVERLTNQEINNTTIYISENDANKTSNQAYILELGPQVNPEYGIKKGDRVILQGSFVPTGKIDENPREKNLVLPDMIKAVLTEAKNCPLK